MSIEETNNEIEKLRETLVKELAKASLVSFLDVIKESGEKIKQSNDSLVNKIATQKAINDLFPMLNLMARIVENGMPKELVFIDADGLSFDLMNRKELEENDLINIFLDKQRK